MNEEKKEALIRIPIGIISYIIAKLWGILAIFLILINLIYTLFAGKRNKDISNFVNVYITYIYRMLRYMSFSTNERPFPFNPLGKNIENVDMKHKAK